MKGVRFLLDTSVYSQRLKVRPDPAVIRWWSGAGDVAMAVSAVCEAELLHGLKKRNSERLWKEYRSFLENRLVIFPMDKPVAEVYASIRSGLQSRGQSRGDMDMIIAATAVCHGLTLATLNQKHFMDIPGLGLVDF